MLTKLNKNFAGIIKKSSAQLRCSVITVNFNILLMTFIRFNLLL